MAGKDAMRIQLIMFIMYIRLYKKKILQVCNKNPTWISDNATAVSAIDKMNSLEITTLLVTTQKDIKKKIKNVVGVLHLHHCLSRGIK